MWIAIFKVIVILATGFVTAWIFDIVKRLIHRKRISTLKVELTERGFAIIQLKDFYGQYYTIQKSSLATKDAIWIGLEGHRLHLTQEEVKVILPLLERFAETGEID